MIDRDSPLPLWAQVLEDLRRRLELGEFDERFPTDRELVEHYGVSRHTVRDAVRRLDSEGLVERHRGRGTFLRSPPIEQPVGALYSLFRSVEDQGAEQVSEVRKLAVRRNAAAAHMLEVPASSDLVYLERLRLADGEALAVDWSWLPADLARPLLDVDFTHTALYQELASRCGIVPCSGWERISPGLSSASHNEALGIGADDPVFLVERLARTSDRAVEWRHAVVRGDRFVFVTRWSSPDARDARLGAEPTHRS